METVNNLFYKIMQTLTIHNPENNLFIKSANQLFYVICFKY
jgi:hypothetical protein